MTAATVVQRAAVPLDRVRRQVLRRTQRLPGFGAVFSRRDPRVAALAVGHALLALALTASFPMLLFVLGPVILGVAHVSADVRYLVLRRRLPGWWKNTVWIGVAILVGLRVAHEAGFQGPGAMRLELLSTGLWFGLALAAGALGAGRLRRALLGLLPLGLFVWASWVDPHAVRLGFVHVHNVVAVVLWLYLFRRRLIVALVPVLVMVLGVAVLMSTHTYAWAEALGGEQFLGLHLWTAAEWVAPGLPVGPAIGLTLVYTFLQSIHYSALLLLIPQDDTPREAARPFANSARSLISDFGWPGVVAIALAAGAVLIGACFDVHQARNTYLSLALFHGYLEVAMLAYFWAAGGLSPRSKQPAATVQLTDSADGAAVASRTASAEPSTS